MISKNSLEWGAANLIVLLIGIIGFMVIMVWAIGMALCVAGKWALNYGENDEKWCN